MVEVSATCRGCVYLKGKRMKNMMTTDELYAFLDLLRATHTPSDAIHDWEDIVYCTLSWLLGDEAEPVTFKLDGMAYTTRTALVLGGLIAMGVVSAVDGQARVDDYYVDMLESYMDLIPAPSYRGE